MILQLRDIGRNLVQFKFQSKKFELRLGFPEDLQECSRELGLSVIGLKSALELFQTKGIKSFNVPENTEIVDETTAKHKLDLVYPGIDWSYLYCLISAYYHAGSQVPLIVCSGKSGAGKSGTVHIAARLLGVPIYESEWQNSPKSSVNAANAAQKASAGFLLFDEFTKFCRKDASSLNSALFLTRSKINQCPVTVFTDIRIPEGITRIRQITRRSRFFHLPNAVSWPSPARVLELCGIATNLVRYAIQHPWKDETPDTSHLIKLLNAIEAAPILVPPWSHRCIGQGFKLIDFDKETPLRDAWLAICDAQIGGLRTDSMILNEVNLAQVLGVSGKVLIDTRADNVYQNIMYIRILRGL